MLRYIAFVWPVSNDISRHAAQRLVERFRAQQPDWKVAVNGRGLVVCYYIPPESIPEPPYLLADRHGVVFGRVFEREYSGEGRPLRPAFDSEATTQRLVVSRGRDLIESYWGRYVAFVHDPVAESTWVVRDPTGAMPCLSTQIDGVQVYCLRLQDCEALGSIDASVNRRYIISQLIYGGRICPNDTGVNRVSAVLAGECIEHRGVRQQRTFYWDPLKIAREQVIDDPQEAVRLTSSTLRACVNAWASCFDSVVLSLSGGLDSAIVLACLKDAPTRPQVIGLNQYYADSDSDERHLARLAAAKAGVELIEWQARPEYRMDALLALPQNPTPYPCCSDLESTHRCMRFLRERGVSAFFTGEAGDELFFRSGELPTAVDYAWQRKMKGLLRTALDDATYAQVSLWSVLRKAASYGLFRQPRSFSGARHRAAARPLITRALTEEAKSYEHLRHPLYEGVPDVPPGKAFQAYLTTFAAQRFYNPMILDDQPVYVGPIASQPFIELSLRIPLYVLHVGGRDRAIARRAFGADIPREIALRKSKGGSQNFYKAVVSSNLGIIRELLVDGFLVQGGYLDGPEVEEVTSGRPTRSKVEVGDLLEYIGLEAWARGWWQRDQRAAA